MWNLEWLPLVPPACDTNASVPWMISRKQRSKTATAPRPCLLHQNTYQFLFLSLNRQLFSYLHWVGEDFPVSMCYRWMWVVSGELIRASEDRLRGFSILTSHQLSQTVSHLEVIPLRRLTAKKWACVSAWAYVCVCRGILLRWWSFIVFKSVNTSVPFILHLQPDDSVRSCVERSHFDMLKAYVLYRNSCMWMMWGQKAYEKAFGACGLCNTDTLVQASLSSVKVQVRLWVWPWPLTFFFFFFSK